MAQYDINLREYWRIIKKRKLTVIIIALTLGAFSTAFATLRAPTPIYTSDCSIKFEKDTTLEGLYAKTLSVSAGDDIETQLSVIKSYAVMKRVARKLDLLPEGSEGPDSSPKAHVTEIIERLQSQIKIARVGYSNIINLEVTDSDSAFAQDLANTIALTYREVRAEEQLKRTSEALKYIAGQLKDVRQKLAAAEEELHNFTRKHQLVSIDLQSENLLLRTKEISDETRKLNEAEKGINDMLGKLRQFVKNPSGSDNNFYSIYGNKQYQDANSILVDLLLKRDSLLQDYTSKHPEIVTIRRKIIESARKMAIILQLQFNEVKKKKFELGNEQAGVNEKTTHIMELKVEYNRLKRRVASYNDMTALLERKNQEALITKAERPEEVSIVKPAFLASSPINPPRKVATGAMGIIIGIILGMVIAFITETFDTSLGAIEDVEETLGTQVLGVIPQGDTKAIQESNHRSSFGKSLELASHFIPQSTLAESFRALRTNIQFRDIEKKIKTIAVTSATPGEGKSMIACNLAITMAQAGTRTLLVGSDLRKPVLAKIFGVEPSPGLSDLLLGNYPWREVVKGITDLIIGKMGLDDVMATPGLDNLHVITSGALPPNPSELINSKRLTDFLEEARKEYDLIIFDTSPILSTTDPAILGTKLDAILLVYRVGSVSRGLLKRSAVQLTQVNCHILGAVLNGMKAEVSPDFQDFKYYKYHYSYGKEGKGKIDRARKRVYGFLKKKEDESREGGGKSGRAGIFIALIAIGFLVAGILLQTFHNPFHQEKLKPQHSHQAKVVKPFPQKR